MEQTGFEVGMAERTTRKDGMKRTILSKAYSLIARILFSIPVKDINCKPKLIRKTSYESLGMKSNDWFIDTELLAKSVRKGYRICTTSLVLKKRSRGKSNVRNSIIMEFLKNIFLHKTGMR